MGWLDGKIAVVTGSTGSIGGAIAQGFLREGAKVVLTEFRKKGAADIARAAGVSEENWMVCQLDASDRASIDALISATIERFGRLDVFMCHAGSNTRIAHFLEATDDDFDFIMNNNAKSLFMCSQAAARAMIPTGGGSIIHTSSLCAIMGHPLHVVYGASKGAVSAMTMNMARDLLEYKIRVNEIIPGLTMSGQTSERLQNPEFYEMQLSRQPMKRIASPEDMVGAAVYLASDKSSFVTGFRMMVDGGKTQTC